MKESQLCASVMKKLVKLDQSTFDAVNDIAEGVTFQVRKYPDGFYSWIVSKDLKVLDPWPASRWPKSVICFEALKKLNKPLADKLLDEVLAN